MDELGTTMYMWRYKHLVIYRYLIQSDMLSQRIGVSSAQIYDN